MHVNAGWETSESSNGSRGKFTADDSRVNVYLLVNRSATNNVPVVSWLKPMTFNNGVFTTDQIKWDGTKTSNSKGKPSVLTVEVSVDDNDHVISLDVTVECEGKLVYETSAESESGLGIGEL